MFTINLKLSHKNIVVFLVQLLLLILLQNCCCCFARLTSTLPLSTNDVGSGGGGDDEPTIELLNYKYEKFTSTSSLGEPIFRLEPQASLINYLNTRGTTLVCLASGVPAPTISWYTTSHQQTTATATSSTSTSKSAYLSQGDSISSSSSGNKLIIGAALQPTNNPNDEEAYEVSKLVTNITNLRVVLRNGAALRLLPFNETDFRSDVHATNYRCVASNQVASIHGKIVTVQAVIDKQQQFQLASQLASLSSSSSSPSGELVDNTAAAPPPNSSSLVHLHVSDELAQLEAPAVFRCKFNTRRTHQQAVESSSSSSLVVAPSTSDIDLTLRTHTIEWFTSDGLPLHEQQVVVASPSRGFSSDSRKFVAFDSGELHVTNVELSDLRRSYGCRLRNLATRKLLATSNMAQLIVRDTESTAHNNDLHSTSTLESAQVLHTIEQVVALDASVVGANDDMQQVTGARVPRARRVLLPCAVQAPHSQLVHATRWLCAPSTSGGGLLNAAANNGRRPVPIEQFASAHADWLHVLQAHNTSALSNIKPQTSRLLVGLTHLTIEWPRAQLSGRYILQATSSTNAPSRTFCDINVIIKRPLALSIKTRVQLSDEDGDEIMTTRLNANMGDDENPLLRADAHRLRVRGAGLVRATPVARLGDRLQLECLARGHPVDQVRWFRQGRLIDTQSARDFQTEITTSELQQKQEQALVKSTLLIKQLQAHDFGLLMFECFARNALGDSARAQQAVQVLSREQALNARHKCTNASLSRQKYNTDLLEHTPQQEQRLLMVEPLERRVLVLEGEPVELECGANTRAAQVEWLEWTGGKDLGTRTGTLDNTQKLRAHFNSERWPQRAHYSQPAHSFNQLFGGDARLVINGTSLQIRAPTVRQHGGDTLFACVQRAAWLHFQAHHQSSLASSTNAVRNAGPALHEHSDLCLEQLFSVESSSSSSLPPQALDSRSELDELNGGAALARQPLVSSISIKVVARPKIDPFEFSRNLEEGMRTVVACTVVSGQAPIDINWFKDGELLASGINDSDDDDYQQRNTLGMIDIDEHANGFSSTLTFHRIRPTHSGQYTCVAANAFGAAEHTSKLIVNVAPFFIESPKSQKVYLNSNVLVNCRAGGQPSPQIRWRKLVRVGELAVGKLVAPSINIGGGGALQTSRTELDFDTQEMALEGGRQQTPLDSNSNNKHEFRIITSNSHIQILENGSMIIRDVQLNDAARYSCQASNGVQPILSEHIQLDVLSPASFEVNYETISVKRDALIKFNCAPRGDQPLAIDWFKGGVPLKRVDVGVVGELTTSVPQQAQVLSKYSELVRKMRANASTTTTTSDVVRHTLMVESKKVTQQQLNSEEQAQINNIDGVESSELTVAQASRTDSGVFVCRARNAHGTDELTYRLLVQEPPDAPEHVQVSDAHSSGLQVSWRVPFDGNLPLTHFVLEYRRTTTTSSQQHLSDIIDNSWSRLVIAAEQQPVVSMSSRPQQAKLVVDSMGKEQEQELNFKMQSVQLKQLLARSAYQIRVAAANAAGQGPFSSIQLASTAEQAPQTRPAELRAEPLSSSSIRVRWRGWLAHSDDPAPVRGYYVSHRRKSSSSDRLAELSSESHSSAAATNWLATSAVAATNYSNIGRQSTQNLQHQLADYELLLEQLERDCKYEVRVQAYNSAGLGPASELLAHTLKFDRPKRPTLTLVAARKQALEFAWSMVGVGIASEQQEISKQNNDLAHHELLGFSLFYKCEYDDWQEVRVPVVFHYVLDNLRCGNKYQIYLSAHNQVGRSDPSDVLSVRTDGTVPVAPDTSAFLSANITELQLDMRAWSSGGCPISSFMIQFKRLHDTNWFILSEGAQAFTQAHKITIPDLKPSTWYKLLVTAMNEAGSTNAEYVFGTLSLDGKPLAAPAHLLDRQQRQGSSSNSLILSGDNLMSRAANSLLASVTQLFYGPAPANHNHHEQQQQVLLFPLSCILLALVVSLAAYLYHNRLTLARRRRQTTAPVQKRKSSSGAGGPHNNNGLLATHKCSYAMTSANNNKLLSNQQQGGHLLHALAPPNACHSATSSLDSTRSSAASSSCQIMSNSATTAAAMKQQHHLIQSNGLLHTTTSAHHCSQSLALDANGEQYDDDTTRSTNYMLDSFLVGAENNNNTLPQHVQQDNSFMGHRHQFRTATMKLFTDSPPPQQQQTSNSIATSSSGLGSSQLQLSTPSGGRCCERVVGGVNLQLIDEFAQPTRNFYNTTNQHSTQRVHAYGSFTSASDLLQRQEQQQQQMSNNNNLTTNHNNAETLLQRNHEPIYQRLDKFGVSAAQCRTLNQFATLNPQLVAKFKQQQRQSFASSTDDSTQHNYALIPPPPPPPQQQQNLVTSFEFAPPDVGANFTVARNLFGCHTGGQDEQQQTIDIGEQQLFSNCTNNTNNNNNNEIITPNDEQHQNECLLIIFLTLGLTNHQTNQLLVAALDNNNNNNNQTSVQTSNKPFWQRPGCFQVGHTRTISIPGCVKFNLSTNACRGYCMSFSIPATEDIGPSSLSPLAVVTSQASDLLSTQQDNAQAPAQLKFSGSGTGKLMMLLSQEDNNEALRRRPTMMMMNKRSSVDEHNLRALIRMRRDLMGTAADLNADTRMQDFLHLSGETRSPLAGAIGDTADKRDVISVAQCCNMIETEDVTVNLRCGFNETRRLVFKSAKTCECFFCKHV